MIAEQYSTSDGVYLVPAFTGLGAPYWDPKARGAILGLTRDSGIRQIVTASLQSVCFQTQDLLSAIRQDGVTTEVLRVDGGMVKNSWLVQHLADILQIVVDRPKVAETTALGVAYLAGLQAGVFKSTSEIARQWKLEKRFEVKMPASQASSLYDGWVDAVSRIRTRE